MRAYFSHCIRGAKGTDATKEDMDANCAAAIEAAEEMRADTHGKLDIYVPAEHEDFVQIAYFEKYLNEQQILAIDCGIVDNCDCLIAYNPDCISRGMQVEIDYAIGHDKPVFYTHGLHTGLSSSAWVSPTVSALPPNYGPCSEPVPDLCSTEGCLLCDTGSKWVKPITNFKVGDLIKGKHGMQKAVVTEITLDTVTIKFLEEFPGEHNQIEQFVYRGAGLNVLNQHWELQQGEYDHE